VHDLLFAPGERWGWEWQDVSKLREHLGPFPAELRGNPASDAAHLRSLWMKQVWVWAAALIVLEVGVSLLSEGTSSEKSALVTAVGGVVVIGLILLVVVTRETKRLVAESSQHAVRPRLTKPWWSAKASRRRAAEAAWNRRAEDLDAAEDERLSTLPVYGAVRPKSAGRKSDVFGGTKLGWQSLVTTLGTSLLASGHRVVVMDFSEAEVAAFLAFAAEKQGFATSEKRLPAEIETIDVFGDMPAAEVADLLVEGLHGDSAQPDRAARATAQRILEATCRVLEPTVSVERIDAALRVLLRADAPPADNDGILKSDEGAAIAELFNDRYLNALESTLVDLESQLYPLRNLGRAAGPLPDNASAPMCEVIAVGREGGALLNELLGDLLVQRVIRRLRKKDYVGSSEPILILIGADVLSRRSIEKLDDLSEAVGLRTVYLFRRLRESAADVAGHGDGVAAVMRLGNADEAERAADLIGRNRRFRTTQKTHTTTEGKTWGWGETETHGGIQTSEAITRSGGTTHTDANADTKQMVHDHIVDREAIQSMAPTELLFVDFARDGQRLVTAANIDAARDMQRQVTAADCNPDIVLLPRVSALPFPEGE
jgi:hypothetical protein